MYFLRSFFIIDDVQHILEILLDGDQIVRADFAPLFLPNFLLKIEILLTKRIDSPTLLPWLGFGIPTLYRQTCDLNWRIYRLIAGNRRRIWRRPYSHLKYYGMYAFFGAKISIHPRIIKSPLDWLIKNKLQY